MLRKRQPAHADCEGGSDAIAAESEPLVKRLRTASNGTDARGLRSVPDVFDALALQHPTHVAVNELWGAKATITWQQLQAWSLAIAEDLQIALNELDVPAGAREVVAVLLRRSCRWLAVTVAVLRCERPFVWLSAGELRENGAPISSDSHRAAEKEEKIWRRNGAALQLTTPCCIVMDRSTCRDAKSSIAMSPDFSARFLYAEDLGTTGRCVRQKMQVAAATNQILCYMMTGGSTGSPKCVEVRQSMALHEVSHYPSVVDLSCKDRILQHTSVFWAASAWGQVDIALAFGATICISDSGRPSARELREADVTVMGVAPSTLAALLPSDVPRMRCIFCWGETLPLATAVRWRSEGVAIVELLISTEYWLSFYTRRHHQLLPGEPTTFDVVPGVDFAVLPVSADNPDLLPICRPGAVGELCISGPAVMSRYMQGGDELSFFRHDDKVYYRAKDIVKLVSCPTGLAVEFRGRNDLLIKVGAEFVNLADVEHRIQATDSRGEVSACLLPSYAQGGTAVAHAFVAIPESASNEETVPNILQRIRRILPNGSVLHLLHSLPRDAVTGKVDRRALQEQITSLHSFPRPLGLASQAKMLWRVMQRYPICWGCLLILCHADALGMMLLGTSVGGGILAWGIFLQLLLPYLWLCTFYLFPGCASGTIPFGSAGVVALLLICGSCWCPVPVLLRRYFHAADCVLAIAGLALAFRRQCPASWTVVFWVCAPQQMCPEIVWWCAFERWKKWCFWVLPSLHALMEDIYWKIAWLLGLWHEGGCADPGTSGRRSVEHQDQAQVVDGARGSVHIQNSLTKSHHPASSGCATEKQQTQQETGHDRACIEQAVYRGFPLCEWKSFEGIWWNECALDIIKISFFSATDQPTLQANPRPVQARTATAALHIEGRVLKLAEKHLQVDTSQGMAAPLAGTDSLSFMALCRGVRTDLRRELEPDVAMGCETLGALVNRIKELPITAREPPKLSAQQPPAQNIHFTPSMWKGQCSWLYEVNELLEVHPFHTALSKLVDRHETLGCTLLDPAPMISVLHNTAGLHTALWPFLREVLHDTSLPYCLARCISRLLDFGQWIVAGALKGAWWRVGPDGWYDTGVSWCWDWKDVQKKIKKQRINFKPPFSVRLFMIHPSLEDGGSGGKSYVHFIVSHAFSDGFSGFPLISDFADLYEAAHNEQEAEAAPVGSALRVCQRRLIDALDCQPTSASPEQCSLRCTEFYLPDSKEEPEQFNHAVCFEQDAGACLRHCGKLYGVPLDVVLLGIVTGALFRAGVADSSGRLTGEPGPGLQHLAMALYTPMRDSAGTDAMIGLFSDWRELSIANDAKAGLTVLGLLLQLGSSIRARHWAMFDKLQNNERILVNILALDEHPRGARGFRERRIHGYCGEQTPVTRNGGRAAIRPLRLTLTQFEPDLWWLSMDCSLDRFSPAWVRRFVVELERMIHDLAKCPLDRVL